MLATRDRDAAGAGKRRSARPAPVIHVGDPTGSHDPAAVFLAADPRAG